VRICITVFTQSSVGNPSAKTSQRPQAAEAQRPARLEAGWEKGGEGNPCDPPQARMQTSIQLKVVGLAAGPKGARSNPHALSDLPGPLLCWNVAGTLALVD
jgi:hypothetical protein